MKGVNHIMNQEQQIDHMARAIQVKKDGVIAHNGNKTEVSIVSGRAWLQCSKHGDFQVKRLSLH